MPIVFSCPCGKSLQAREEFAGRKMKCSKCGQAVPVPKARPALASVGAGGNARPPLATPVRTTARKQPALSSGVLETPTQLTLTPRLPSRILADSSQVQYATPWLPGDKERYQRGNRPEREWAGVFFLLLILAACLAVAAWVQKDSILN